jgi:hypothetical protein
MQTSKLTNGENFSAQSLIAPVGIKASTIEVQLLLRLQSRRKRRRKVIANDDSRTRRRAEKTVPSCPL